MRMELVFDTIDHARDYRGAVVSDYFRKLWQSFKRALGAGPSARLRGRAGSISIRLR
jgi:hypothetical protein